MSEKPEQWAVELRETLKRLAEAKQDYLMDVALQRAFEDQTRELREALKPFAQRQTIAEALADPPPPVWAGLSIEDRIKVMGENKAKHDAEILAARQALGERP